MAIGSGRWANALTRLLSDKERVLVLKLDVLLLVWAFISGLTKVRLYDEAYFGIKLMRNFFLIGHGSIFNDPGLRLRNERKAQFIRQ